MSGTGPPITVVPPLSDASALKQGMLAPMNALVATDQTPTPVTYRFLNSLWNGEQQIWAQIVSFQSTLENMLAQIQTLTHGVTDGSDAAAGIIGEYLTASGSASVGNGVATDLVTLTLPAGDWDVAGSATFTPSGPMTGADAWLSAVAVTEQDPGRMVISGQAAGIGTLAGLAELVGARRYSVAAPATLPVYLGVRASFASGTVAAAAFLRARRVR